MAKKGNSLEDYEGKRSGEQSPCSRNPGTECINRDSNPFSIGICWNVPDSFGCLLSKQKEWLHHSEYTDFMLKASGNTASWNTLVFAT